MAWFSVDKETNSTPAFNFDRLLAALERQDWNFDKDSEGNTVCHSGFDGFYTVFALESEGVVLSIYSWSSGAVLGEEKFSEALAWAANWNKETIFGTARPFVDEDNDMLMRVDCSFILEAGVSDEQLDEYLNVGTMCNTQALEKYCEDMGIPRPNKDEE